MQVFDHVTRIPEEDIVTVPAEQRIRARFAKELVIAGTAVEKVIADLFDGARIAYEAPDGAWHYPQVAPGLPEPRRLESPEVSGEHVIAGTAEELVLPFPAFQPVLSRAADQRVIAQHSEKDRKSV